MSLWVGLVVVVGAAWAIMVVIKNRRDAAAAADPDKEFRPKLVEENRKTGEEAGVEYGPRGANADPNTIEDTPSPSPVPPPAPDATPSPLPPAAAAPPPEATPSAPPPEPTASPRTTPPTDMPHAPPAPSATPHSPVAPRRVDPPFGDAVGDEEPVITTPEAALPTPAGAPLGPEMAASPPTQAAPPCAVHGVPNCPACGSEMSAEPMDPGRRGPIPEAGEEPPLPPLDTSFGSGTPHDPAAHATVAPMTSPPALVDQVQAPMVETPVVDPEAAPLPQPENESLGAGSDLALADPAADSGTVADDPVETG